MAVPARTNRVTGPLDDEAKECLCSAGIDYSSNGSDHDVSTCLSGLVHAFLETGGRCTPSAAAYGEVSWGFNARICKARWDASNGLAVGRYEYIDVVAATTTSEKETWYIVDLYFAAKFEVARAIEEYKAVVVAVSRVAGDEDRRRQGCLVDEVGMDANIGAEFLEEGDGV
ncbi:hypothetical protein Cni_G26929 [Canna indica]|uniref:Uncharacterized protein n=1 Tax=Canna indica TaxID=4628 RepID=A0AAQ3QQX7_9LILI|nr:hypothetical protein Cni_G26929 [Canna indica]